MKSLYEDLPKLKVKLSLTTLIGAILTIFIFLILPIGFMNYIWQNQASSKAPNVGSYLSAQINSFVANLPNNLSANDGSNSLIVVGIILILVSLTLVFYLLIENNYRKRIIKSNHHEKSFKTNQ